MPTFQNEKEGLSQVPSVQGAEIEVPKALRWKGMRRMSPTPAK